MWTETLNPSVLEHPQIKIPRHNLSSTSNISNLSLSSNNSSYDWDFLDSLDPALLRSTDNSKAIREISAKIMQAYSLPTENPQRILKIFNITKIAIESATEKQEKLHSKLRDQKKELKNLQSQYNQLQNRPVSFQCPVCLKYYDLMEKLDRHIASNHQNCIAAWRAMRQPQSSYDSPSINQYAMTSSLSNQIPSNYNLNNDVPSMLKVKKLSN